MSKIVKYGSIIASVVGLLAVIIAGIKVTGNNYDVVCEGIIIGVCLFALFISAVYNVSKEKE